MLLELCFGEVVEDEPIRWNCLGVLGQLNGMTDLYTTRRWWTNRALGKTAPDPAEAIRICLNCASEPKTADLEDASLRAAIYGDVVKPLEDVFELFNT